MASRVDPHTGPRLIRSGLAVTVIGIVGIATGALIQLLIAWFYGARGDVDAFVVGSTLPLYVQAVIVGSLGVVVMPALSAVRVQFGDTATKIFAAQLAARLMLILGISSLLGVYFAEAIVHLTAPGLPASGVAASARIARLLWPAVSVLGISTVFVALLQLEGRFVWPAVIAVSGSVVNAALIIIAAPRFGIDAVAIGNLANAVFQITLLLWLCFARDREPAPTPCLSRRANFVLVTAIPLVVSGLLIRITPVIDRYLASEFDEGTIARLAYAFRLVTIAPGVFTAGVGAVLFPRMSLSVAREQLADLQRTVAVGLGLLFTFCVPTVLIGGILAPDIVRILFERGAFTPADTAAVAQAIRLYLPSLLAIVLSVVTARALYALNRVRLVAVVGAIESVVYIAYTYALMRVLGWQGIAVGFSAYCLISLAWQLAYLRHRLGPIVTEGMGMVFGRAVSAGVSATLIVWAITRALDSPWMKVALGTVAGIACFTIALRITRSPELRIIVGLLPRFRTKSTPVAESIEP